MKHLLLVISLTIALIFTSCAQCVAGHDETGLIRSSYCALYGRHGQCYYEYIEEPYTYTVCDKWINNQ